MPDLETRLRELFADVAPPSVDPVVLSQGARRYARRAQWSRAAGAAAAVVVLAAGVALTAQGGRDRGMQPAVPTPRSTLTHSWELCQQSYPEATPSEAAAAVAGSEGVLVCADTTPGSRWTGSLPPDNPVTSPDGLRTLVLEPRTDESGCAGLPDGPAFRILVGSRDGRVVQVRNDALRCNGWPLLEAYYVAVADNDTDPRTGVLDDGFLGCPPVLGRTALDGQVSNAEAVPAGTRFTTATLCLHPTAVPPRTRVPVIRGIRSAVLGDNQLATLNRDLARGSSSGPKQECAAEGWLYVVRGLTSTGELLELWGSCLDELVVIGRPRAAVALGAATQSLLRASVAQ